jgi:hypothetical protein
LCEFDVKAIFVEHDSFSTPLVHLELSYVLAAISKVLYAPSMEASIMPLPEVLLQTSIGIVDSKVIAFILMVPANIDITILLMEAHATPRPLLEVADISTSGALKDAESMLCPV